MDGELTSSDRDFHPWYWTTKGSGRELLEDNKRRITRTVEAARDSAATVWHAETAVMSAKAAKSIPAGTGESVPAYQMIH